ncbi:MAG: TSCPD domain-containing protein [Candidatus Heimdallarchaeaceae archaeon]
MTPKITPTKNRKRFKKYNCSGRLRVDVIIDDGEISEVILLPERGGCKYNQQLIGRLISGMLACNISIDYILQILDKNDPCPSVVMRMKRENLPKEECGLGGCSKIVKEAIELKLKEINDKISK